MLWQLASRLTDKGEHATSISELHDDVDVI